MPAPYEEWTIDPSSLRTNDWSVPPRLWIIFRMQAGRWSRLLSSLSRWQFSWVGYLDMIHPVSFSVCILDIIMVQVLYWSVPQSSAPPHCGHHTSSGSRHQKLYAEFNFIFPLSLSGSSLNSNHFEFNEMLPLLFMWRALTLLTISNLPHC